MSSPSPQQPTSQETEIEYRYAFLHGFASSPSTEKAVHLQQFMKEQFGIELKCPDLNIPSFEQLTVTNMLNYLKNDVLIARDDITNKRIKWRVVASSLGGFTACRFVQLYPGIIDSLLLLAPAFDIQSIWQSFISLEKWEKLGAIPVFNYKYNENRNIQVDHLKDLLNHPSYPLPEELLTRREDTLGNRLVKISVIHGSEDSVIPYGNTLKFVKSIEELGFSEEKSAIVLKVQDGHGLIKEESLKLMETHITQWVKQ